jgi:hypothetical protein
MVGGVGGFRSRAAMSASGSYLISESSIGRGWLELKEGGVLGGSRGNEIGDIDGVILEDGTLLHFPPHAGRQFAKLIREGQLPAAVGFGTVNDFGQTIAVAMLGRSADSLALVEPLPAKPKRHPEDRKIHEEES